MKVLVDENIPRMTVDRLRELGHDVKDIRGRWIKVWWIPNCGVWR